MELLRLPFFDELEDSQNVLLAGAGGGFDVFCGLPLYFALRDSGKTVHLANLSFSTLYASTGRRMGRGLVRVDADTEGSLRYFPELYLSRWFRERGEDVPVYCFGRTGVAPLTAAYKTLIEELKPDTLLLIDGGTDSLMRGDETGLGTPQEDAASLAAALAQDVPKKLLACIGFGIDTYHGVCHAQFLEAVAELTLSGDFLGAWTLTEERPEARLYREACEYVFRQMPGSASIVSSSILSAVEGRFGDYHATDRAVGSALFINPLMTLYWCFRLEPVARRLLYLDELMQTETYEDVHQAIVEFRVRHGAIKDWQSLPM